MNEQDKQKHLKTKRNLKIIGLTLLIVGAVCVIVGFVDFFISMGNGMPKLFWLMFIGFPMIAVGIFLSSMGFRKEIAGYVKNESVPVINEMGQEIKPAISAVSSAVKEGLQEEIVCDACGTKNDLDSKFCSNCGKSLVCLCPECGEQVKPNSNFCDNCGKKLEK